MGAADALVERAPWDLVLAADVLYERRNVDELLALLPRLGARSCSPTPAGLTPRRSSQQAAGAWRVEQSGIVYALSADARAAA